MNSIDKIQEKAHLFNLTAKKINNKTIKIHNENFLLDGWIIRLDGKHLELLHESKKKPKNKCQYHIQRKVCARNWVWLLQSINEHNQYTITKRWNVRENLVDRVLKQYEKRRCNNER